MNTRTLFALGSLLLGGCGTGETDPARSGSAASALQALETRDEETLAGCVNAVAACERNRPDAAAPDRCQRLAEHCSELEQRLATIREPAVGCLKAVENCEEHAPEQASCRRDVSACESVQDEVAGERGQLLACSSRIEACLARAAELPDAASVACENIAAACERAAAAQNRPDAAAPGRSDSRADEADDPDPRGRPERLDAGPPVR